ncbi:MAG: hydrogenase [Planctomycetes bacterium]|nr:hydrogenase [Planctomycetota bacterium]
MRRLSKPEQVLEYQREIQARPKPEIVIRACSAGCRAQGAQEASEAFVAEVEKRALQGRVRVMKVGCHGLCSGAPVIVVDPGETLYQKVTPEDVPAILDAALNHGVVKRLCWSCDGTVVPRMSDVPFYKKQTRHVLKNCGVFDPRDIEDSIAHGGYQTLGRVLTAMSPDQVVDEVIKSGLRGRGGAGFPTGRKWAVARAEKSDVKYLICNGGEPAVIEGDPHLVLEGMLIAAYAIGARHGIVYVRAEHAAAGEHMAHAVRQAREVGMLGHRILGTDLHFEVEVRAGAGVYVGGEETALIAFLEGQRAMARQKPPFPAQKGLWGKPTCVNNLETFANVPLVLRNGASHYGSTGSALSKGTKVLALTGKVNCAGLIEVPLGTPLGDIIYEIGGGIPRGKKFKAAHIGGPAGGCVPREHLNMPIDYEAITEAGSAVGTSSLIVMDEDTCMVDTARFLLQSVQNESCGKCSPCRLGTRHMLEILLRICEGQGEQGDIETLLELATSLQDTALCGLGRTAANPVLTTIRYFRDEYESHIRQKRCPAGVCPALVRAPCQNACPAGVNVPGFVSLIGEKRYPEALRLHRERNPFASVCSRVCFHVCEDKCRRSALDESVSVRGVKRFMADQETTVQLPEIRANEANAKRKVAIIGAGPAGLSCAYFLARLGYRPKVFEAHPQAGGMLVQAIPAYRLPRGEVAREVRMIEGMGVEIRTGVVLGKDITLKGLRDQGYEAVFLGVGAPLGTRLGIPGDDAQGGVEAVNFLRDYNLRGSAPVGRNVAVIGGGNAAFDAARTAMRLGAETVTVLYRRSRAEMPAYAEEVHEAEREGVRVRDLVAPTAILVQDGRATGVQCRAMVLGEFDRTGRRRPVPSPEPEFVVQADQVIAAIGQTLDVAAMSRDLPIRCSRAGFIQVNPLTGQTSVEWVFAGGDAATGPASVVEAVADGERAAAGIDMYLTGQLHAFWRDDKEVDTFFDPKAEPAQYPRARAELIPVGQRRRNFDEVETCLADAVALHEAKRCLRCDLERKTAAGRTQSKATR